MAVELSAAIIFKNEIRCLERCLKSLLPLRDYLSVEIVMADTGSDDGSRAVAEKYADVVFDFPWVDDFSAARNAVLERCSGAWALILDSDEWVEADRAELEALLRSENAKTLDGAMLRNRSYATAEFDEYSDLYMRRLLRMGAKPRYEGAIHEQVRFGSGSGEAARLTKSLLHHDGYVMLNDGSEAGKAKRARNIRLLRTVMEREPDSLRRQMEFLDSGKDEPDFLDLVRGAVEKVREKAPEWEKYGPPLLRKAVQEAHRASLKEWDEWVGLAWRMFPESWYTRVDVSHFEMTWAYVRGKYEEALRAGERYVKEFCALQELPCTPLELTYSPLQWGTAQQLVDTRLILSDAYRHLGRHAEAVEQLRLADWRELTTNMIANAVDLLARLYQFTEQDVSDVTSALWDGLCDKSRGEKRAAQRKEAFLTHGQSYFTDAKKQKLEAEGKCEKPIWGFLLPLAGRCRLGDIAALLASQTPEEADAALGRIDDLTALPVFAFVHALKTGAEFPIPTKPLTVGESDRFALALRSDPAFLNELAVFAASEAKTDQELLWAHSLTFSAQRLKDAEAVHDEALLRAFVRAQSAFLSRCYSAYALAHPEFLPSAHRFAFHLVNAFSVLAPTAVAPDFSVSIEKNLRAALRSLKEAAVAAPEQKKFINALLDTLTTT